MIVPIKFTYIVIDDKSFAQLVSNKETLIKTIQLNENPEVFTFYSVEQAQTFQKQFNSNTQTKSPERTNIDFQRDKSHPDELRNPSTKQFSFSNPFEKKACVPASKDFAPITSSSKDKSLFKTLVTKNKEDFEEGKIDCHVNPKGNCFLYFAGSSSSPEKSAHIIYKIKDQNSNDIDSFSDTIGEAKVNQAVYYSLIAGMSKAADIGIKRLECIGHNEVVIKLALGTYKVEDPKLKELLGQMNLLKKRFDNVDFKWVTKGENLALSSCLKKKGK